MVINIIVIIFFFLSIIFSLKYKFVQFKSFKVTKNVLIEKKEKSAYQTFIVSLASHIGTGNIVGISAAIIYGGAGTVFWIWVFAITSSIFSLMENTLSQVYKVKIDGEFRGGACYYIKSGLNNEIIAIVFACFLVLSNTIFFQPLQINTICETLNLSFGIKKEIILIILIAFTIIVVFGGTKKIIKFCEGIVPVMSITYIIVALVIIVFNIKLIPSIFGLIFEEAFNIRAITSGLITSCMLVGFRRSMFSHESGLGTMPAISAMSNVEKPAEQGFIQVTGVYFDTLIICTLTAIMVLIFQVDYSNYTGCDLILELFNAFYGKYGKYVSSFFLFTFALATVVSEFYLGESNLLFLSKQKKNPKTLVMYKLLFLMGIIFGVFGNVNSIWKVVDFGMVLLGVVNIYAIFKLRKIFERELMKI